MSTGVVKWFSGFRTLVEGAKVEYELGESPKGLQATNVRVI